MQKIFINKETDMVEQILKVETNDELPDNYFPNCYAIIDEEDKINAYNLKYNKETKEFEVVEGLPAKDEVVVEEKVSNTDIEQLKKENEELKKENEIFKERLESIEETLSKVVEKSALY
jgi:FtsZ-binding cell division protein ZapB